MKSIKIILFYAITLLLLGSCGVKQKEYLYDYIPVKQKADDKKISLIDYDGNIILEDEFDYTSSIIPTDEVITEIKNDGKVRYWQIVDKKVKPLIDNDFFGGTPFFEGVAVVRDEKGLLSLIDKKGEAVIPNLSNIGEYQIVRTGVMSDGLIRFKTTEGLWGYLNKNGEVVIKPAYLVSENFVNGFARVSKSESSFSIINTKGEEVFKGDEEVTYYPIDDNLMPFIKKTGDDYFAGLINVKTKEKVIKDAKYTVMNIPYNGFISVKNKDNEWGMVDANGEVIGDLRLKYTAAPVYSKSGVIVAKDDKKIKMFSSKGELIKSFDEYVLIYPFGKSRFLAWRKNEKFDILDNEGKEVSKESYIFAGISASDINTINNEGFSLFEQTGVIKNFFGLESKYFEFDKSFSKIFKSITTSDIAGITQNLNIEQVLAKFPYNKYSSSNGSSTSKGDNFQLGFYVASTKTETASSSGATVDPVATDPYGSNSQPASTIEDKYPFLSEYNSNYITYADLGNNINITYSFNFDQTLKTPVYGKDPIFTDQITTIGYDINRPARLLSLSIGYSLGDIDTKIFFESMVKKIVAAGWKKDENSGYYVNAKNSFKLDVTNSNITIYFSGNSSTGSTSGNYYGDVAVDSAATYK
jgi:hypothetical protein